MLTINETPVRGCAATGSAPAWYCIRSQPKQEHLAAVHLQKDARLEVYLPRIRFRRSTRQGPAWFTEALFPGYLFARFELATCMRRVHHARGVQGIVHFGDQWPVVPGRAIEDLRATVGANQVHVIEDSFQPGETVIIAGGPLHNLHAVIKRVMPGSERIAVLLDFLGRQVTAELPANSILRGANARERVI